MPAVSNPKSAEKLRGIVPESPRAETKTFDLKPGSPFSTVVECGFEVSRNLEPNSTETMVFAFFGIDIFVKQLHVLQHGF